ncbi:MAG: DUF4364 family protein [Oscillospiraceae bacterium]|nr:DUF4364 family protein [Oscillospiraceae bacterium]
MEQQRGFIHDMLDVKVLILYVMSRVMYPVDLQKIYELSFQDDCLSYFDLAQAVPQMVETGHLEEVDGNRFVITEKGREACAVTEDAIAYPVMQRAQAATDKYNRAVRRSSFVKTKIVKREGGDFSVQLSLNDEVSDLLKMELMAPTQRHAYRLANAFEEKAELIYRTVMDQLLAKEKEDT